MQARRHAALAAEDIESTFTDALQLLRSVRRTLSTLLERVKDDEPGLLKEVGSKHAELESAIRRAFEAEERYNAWQEKNAGITRACEIDFDALRADIACRLQTIRDCCQEGV